MGLPTSQLIVLLAIVTSTDLTVSLVIVKQVTVTASQTLKVPNVTSASKSTSDFQKKVVKVSGTNLCVV